jgi:hypothetical protein
MTIRAKLAAFAAVLGDVGAPDVVLPLSDSDALALAAMADLEAIGPQPEGVDAVVAWAGKVQAARAKFWDAFEGETVDGVRIVRRRG